jgi:Tol biopolymer transport system component
MHPFVLSLVALLTLLATGCKEADRDSGADAPAIGFDKTVIVYQTFRPDTQRAQLYATASDGSAVHLLAPDRLSSASVAAYELSPAGVHVAYRLVSGGMEPERLNIANVHTGEVIGVTGRSGGPRHAGEFEWSPAGTHLAYTGGDTAAAPGQLFIYDLAADRSIRVSPGETAGRTLSTLEATPDLLQWSPNGAALAYRSDYGTTELNAIAPDGSAFRRMSAFPTTGSAVFDIIEWAPDSSRIAYVAAQDNPNEPELFVTNFDGSGNLQLSPALFAGGAVLSVFWSPDSLYVAMAVAQDAFASRIALHGAAADGTHNWNIATNLSGSGAVDPFMIEWAPDSTHVAYLADPAGTGQWGFYSAAVPTGNISALSAAGTRRSPEASIAWDTNSTLLAYTLDADTAGSFDLYTSGLTGAPRTRISGTLSTGASVRDFSWSTLGGSLAYRVVDSSSIVVRVFETASNATTEFGRFSRAPLLIEPEWLPRTRQLVFVADIRDLNISELHIADTSSPTRAISHGIDRDSPLTGEDVVSFELFP